MFCCIRTLARQNGFTFNELLVAMNLTAVAVLGYSLSSVDVVRRETISDHSTVAIHLAQDKLEELQAQSHPADINLCPDDGDHSIAAKSNVSGIFDRCWSIAPSPLGSDLKQIEVTVSWRDYQLHQTKLSTLRFVGE
jgi:Tfp pilus assembly protein PilV